MITARLTIALAVTACCTAAPAAFPTPPQPLAALPALNVTGYLGRWYQQALYPNFFQRVCVSDTTATYRDLGDGTIEVRNRCRKDDGSFTEVIGQARPPAGAQAIQNGTLRPAKLEVRFAPSWLSWLPMVWGRYWVVDLAEDGRYAIVSEPSREYLWVLSRAPKLSPADQSEIRSRLTALGFDLAKLQVHTHAPSAPSDTSPP